MVISSTDYDSYVTQRLELSCEGTLTTPAPSNLPIIPILIRMIGSSCSGQYEPGDHVYATLCDEMYSFSPCTRLFLDDHTYVAHSDAIQI